MASYPLEITYKQFAWKETLTMYVYSLIRLIVFTETYSQCKNAEDYSFKQPEEIFWNTEIYYFCIFILGGGAGWW